MQALEENVDKDWAGISSSLEEIRTSLLSRNGCLINMTADGKTLTNSEKVVSKFLDSLPSNSLLKTASWNAQLPSGNEAIVIPTQVRIYMPPPACFPFSFLDSKSLFINIYILQVNYVGKAANLYETGYQLDGSAYVISKYISNTWLWDRVRVSGGAYGGFCDFDTHSGTMLCHYMFVKGYNCYFRILCFWGFFFRSILLLILS